MKLNEEKSNLITEWQDAFASLVKAVQRFTEARKERGSGADAEFAHLCGSALALFRIEEAVSLEELFKLRPHAEPERSIHQAAMGWAQRSFVPSFTLAADQQKEETQLLKQAILSLTKET